MGVLILSTLLITSASALTFFSLTASTTSTTSAATVKFITAADTPSGTVINSAGTFVTLPIKAFPNATLTYQFGLNVSNTDTLAHSIRLRSISITSGQGAYSNSTSKIEFDIVNTAGTVLASITYRGANSGSPWTVTGSPTAYFSVPASTKFAIQIITACDATASTGVTTGIQLAVDVQ